MIKNAPTMLTAFGISAATIALPAAAQAQDVNGWDRPNNAEFVMRDVPAKTLVPEIREISRDVHVDCDLLLRSGDRLARGDAIPTNGFAMQFNFETQYTTQAMSQADIESGNPPGTAMARIRAWEGQLNPHALSGAIQTHLEPQHGITMGTLRDGAHICIDEHSDHGVQIRDLPSVAGGFEGIHPDWR